MASVSVKKIGGWKTWVGGAVVIFTCVSIVIIISSVFNSNGSSGAGFNWIFWIGLAGIGLGGFLLLQKNDAGKWLTAVSVGLVLLSFAAGWLGQQNVIQAGNRLGSYLATGSNSRNQTNMPQASLCGPGKLVNGTATYSKPLTLKRELACQIRITKTGSIPAEIRYNGNTAWIPWPAFKKVPVASDLVKTFQVRPANVDDQVAVLAKFPREL